MNISGRSISDPKQIANYFNEFFANAPAAIISDINPTDVPTETHNVDLNIFSFTENPVSLEEIVEAVEQLQAKKSQDFNGLSMWFVKKFILEIITPLHHLISCSLATGVVPQQLKIAKVVPVFKSGDAKLLDNYRPISLLSSFSKIYEKIVGNRLSDFLEENKLLSNFQFGFRKKHSTIHPLIHFMNFTSRALNEKEHTIAIFCDLRKAFDTVNHSILLKKLEKLGIQGYELLWFTNYLSDRKQFVTIDNNLSDLLNIILGVPQGSILGPLLFLVYINDLPECSKLFSLLFADDTTLLLSHSNLDTLISIVNTEFKKVVDYFRSHKLALHPEKTKFMILSSNADIRNSTVIINMNSNNGNNADITLIKPITQVLAHSDTPAIKFLGVYIDPQLNFKYHIDTIAKKLSKSLYFMRSAKNIISLSAMRSVYYAMFHSHLIYGIHIWSCSTEASVHILFKKQKIAIRLITQSRYNAHTESLFKTQKILPLPKMCEFFKLQFMQQFTYNGLPSSFSNTWTLNAYRNENLPYMELRNHDQLDIPFARITITERFPLTSFPKLWRDFPDVSIKSLSVKNTFNKKLKEYYLAQLSNNYVCERLLCPSCHLNL
jgi:hypothetical protein